MKQIFLFGGVFAAFVLAIFFPAVVLEGARMGLELWFHTLLPTLFPFMILSNLLIQSGMLYPLLSMSGNFTARFLGISASGFYALLCGFFFGYPCGAKILADLLKTGQIELEEASLLMVFCSNASPAFLTLFVLTEHLQRPEWIPETLLILYGTPALLCLLLSTIRRKAAVPQTCAAPISAIQKQTPAFSLELLDASVSDAIQVILKLGGYIMLFAVLANASARLLPLPAKLAALVTVSLEITGGVPAVIQAFPAPYNLLLLLPFLAFGGICSAIQIGSVIKDTPLSLHRYVTGKLLLAIPVLLLGALWLL